MCIKQNSVLQFLNCGEKYNIDTLKIVEKLHCCIGTTAEQNEAKYYLKIH